MLTRNHWLLIGICGQLSFTARFVVQWLVSERRGKSVVPTSFWWLSLLGGSALLSYAISRRDPVITAGQAMGLIVYIRNLILVKRAQTSAFTRLGRSRSALLCSWKGHDDEQQLIQHMSLPERRASSGFDTY